MEEDENMEIVINSNSDDSDEPDNNEELSDEDLLELIKATKKIKAKKNSRLIPMRKVDKIQEQQIESMPLQDQLDAFYEEVLTFDPGYEHASFSSNHPQRIAYTFDASVQVQTEIPFLKEKYAVIASECIQVLEKRAKTLRCKRPKLKEFVNPNLSETQKQNRIAPIKKDAVWKQSPGRSDPKKKQRRKGSRISSSLKLDIVGMLQELNCNQKAIAAHFNVSEKSVHRIKRELFQNSEKFDSLVEEEIGDESYKEIVGDILFSFEAEDKPLRSAKQIHGIAKHFATKKQKLSTVKRLMSVDHNNSFKTVKSFDVDINEDSHKFKRHHYSKFFVSGLLKNYRYVVFDETHIVQLNYCSKAWSKRGKLRWFKTKAVQPRATMVAAVDNYGNKYMSVSQAHSNQQTTLLMLWQLTILLQQEDADFRENTILLLDCAPWHTTKAVRALLRLVGLSYSYSSPHSPMISPVENFHSQIKSGDLNPKDETITKQSFDVLGRLLFDKAGEVLPESILQSFIRSVVKAMEAICYQNM